MVSYPHLTLSQQKDLPALIKPASPLSAKFDDSTHQLWHCETVDGPMVFKHCHHQTIQTSTFWLAINHLFAIDFPASLSHIEKVHRFLNEHGVLRVPDYVASEASVFVLSRYLEGEDVTFDHVSDGMVMRLAQHLAQLHHIQYSTWGALYQRAFSNQQWSSGLKLTLSTLAERHPIAIPDDIFKQAIQQATEIKIDTFSPIMLDLRWDQMLHQQGELSAIVDMDAFVVGPRELELVLLEYQLNQHQADIFADAYQATAPWPDLTEQRYSYRLLLFLMNSLGETDVKKWMNAAIRW